MQDIIKVQAAYIELLELKCHAAFNLENWVEREKLMEEIRKLKIELL